MAVERGKKNKVYVAGINLIVYDIGERARRKHDEILSIIVDALYSRGYRKINYDHIKEIYKRDFIPLNLGGHRWDIVIQTGEGKYIGIEIKTLKRHNEIIMRTDDKGVRYVCLGCGGELWSNMEYEIEEFDGLLKNNALECPYCKGKMFIRQEENGNF